MEVARRGPKALVVASPKGVGSILNADRRVMSSVLTLNAGSSSIRFAFFAASEPPVRSISGRIERIGQGGTSMQIAEPGRPARRLAVDAADRRGAMDFLLGWLQARQEFAGILAVGHRVVYGLDYAQPRTATPELLSELRRMAPDDPEHLPAELELIETLAELLPTAPQVLCFDTAFHRGMPEIARLLPIPRRYRSQGVHRYGFHGLSYTYLLEELVRLNDPAASAGRVILAHLGNGSSLAAVRDGRSIDTSMGFTPTGGVMMSTRSGDLDPGVVTHIARSEGLDAAGLQRLLSHESGLLGVSQISADMRDLLAIEQRDARAAQAVAMYCYQVKKCIGGFAAALGGLDTLVFAGGIGENSAVVRARICAELRFLGVELDAAHNEAGADSIGIETGRVSVRVIRTDEESVLARAALRAAGLAGS